MRKRCVAIVIVALVGGCTDQTHTSSDGSAMGGGESFAEKLGASIAPSDWTLEKTVSGLDGETYTASRTYEFVDRQTRLQVDASCASATGVSELTIDSYVGDPLQPNDGSAFLGLEGLEALGAAGKLKVPVGRVKASDGAVTELGAYFDLGDDYNNRLKFDFNNPVAQSIIPQAPGYNAFASTFEQGDVNYAKLLLAALPMTVEVKNGAGVFEIQIDRGKELLDTLQACGADGPLLSETYAMRAEEAEQKFRVKLLKDIKDICGYRGVIRETDEQWQQTAESLSIPLDCAASAPNEFAIFNAKIDGYLEKARQKGITCDRDALVRQAGDGGLDGSGLWEHSLESYCRS